MNTMAKFVIVSSHCDFGPSLTFIFLQHKTKCLTGLISSEVISRLKQATDIELQNDIATHQGFGLHVALHCTKTANDAIQRLNLMSLEHELNSFIGVATPSQSNTTNINIHHGPQVMVLLGNAGAGKTLSARWLEKHLWTILTSPLNDSNTSSQVLPVFISLPLYHDQFNDDDVELIDHALEQKLLSTGMSSSQAIREIDALQQIVDDQSNNTSLLVILDGYDEVRGTGNMYKRLGLGKCRGRWQSCRVIVCCRSQYVSDHALFASNMCPPGYNSTAASCSAMFVERHLVGFSAQDRHQYICNFVNSEWNEAAANDIKWATAKDYKDALQSLFNITPTSSNQSNNSSRDDGGLMQQPFLLSMVLKIVPTLDEQQGRRSSRVRPVEVYMAFVDHWVKREIDRHRMHFGIGDVIGDDDTRYVLMDYMRELGLVMLMEDKQVADFTPLSQRKAAEAHKRCRNVNNPMTSARRKQAFGRLGITLSNNTAEEEQQELTTDQLQTVWDRFIPGLFLFVVWLIAVP